MQDEYVRDTEGDRIHKGHYYKIRLPDGRELGSRPYTTQSDASPFISTGPANTGDLYCIHDDEWPAQTAIKLFVRAESASSSDLSIGYEGQKVIQTSDESKGALFYGDRANGRNFICLMQKDNKVRLWVAEADGSTGHNFIRSSHGDAVSFEVRFIYVCNT